MCSWDAQVDIDKIDLDGERGWGRGEKEQMKVKQSFTLLTKQDECVRESKLLDHEMNSGPISRLYGRFAVINK